MPKPTAAPSDERRERFEKFFNRQELGHLLISNVRKTACWETYQQAERDIREQCAQRTRELQAKLENCSIELGEARGLLQRAREDYAKLAERIRGKGVQ